MRAFHSSKSCQELPLVRFQNRARSVPPSAPESTAETTPKPSVTNDVGSPGVKSEINICVDGNRFSAPANQQRTKKVVVDNAPVSAARLIASLDWEMDDVLVAICAWASVMVFSFQILSLDALSQLGR